MEAHCKPAGSAYGPPLCGAAHTRGAGLAKLSVNVGTDLFNRRSQTLCVFQVGWRQFHNIWQVAAEGPHTLLRRLFFAIPRQHRQEAALIESFARRPNWLYKRCPADTQ